ncbi:MAG: MGH1-like glycoside hydrolase domain-containing protein, partial [Omnitrophica WOR_2 bacterium]
MREWNLKAGDPLSLTLAADARLSPTDYCNDQIWELILSGGEPPALALQTTFGLRVRSLRLFPRFIENEVARSDPASFARPPSVRKFYPNYLQVTCSPFTGIDVICEYWVPQSQAVAGRMTMINTSDSPRSVRLEWAALLTPSQEGQRMAPGVIEGANILSGRSEGLVPVVFLSGGPQVGAGPYPSLFVDLPLAPGAAQSITWAHAALSSEEESYRLAHSITTRNFDAEWARIELVNSNQVEIHTGDPDWDAAFALSQKVALSLFLGPTQNLPYPSFVLARQPDMGFSLRGDGRDYNLLWSGQNPFDSYFLADQILFSAPQLVKGLLQNFFSTQNEAGFIDFRTGLGGQRSQLMAAPLLANLTWRVYKIIEDRSFLEEAFPCLKSFLDAWFDPGQDRDGDGVPEWSHPMQTGYDDHPLFSRWQPFSKGLDISASESPALCSFLLRECQALIHIAKQIGQDQATPELKDRIDRLRSAVENSWDVPKSQYQYWDRDTHTHTPLEILGEREGSGEIIINRDFQIPARLLFLIETKDESSRRLQLFLHGVTPSGQHLIERTLTDRFIWYFGKASATSDRVFSKIEQIVIQGLTPIDHISVYRVGYSDLDQTLLLPLWAGIPGKKRAQALLKNTIMAPRRFWKPYG